MRWKRSCTPGYWKNHTDSWPAAGYSPSQKVGSVFAQAALYPSLGSDTLHGALSFKGGSTIRDTLLSLASKLDADNNLGCPLN